MRRAIFIIAMLELATVSAWNTRADEVTNQPYIDKLKKGLTSESASSTREGDPFIQEQKKKMSGKQGPLQDSQGYAERLRKSVIDPPKDSDEGKNYSEQERVKLEPKQLGGAIAAVHEGKSELHAKIEGNIHHAAGFRFAPSLVRSVAGTPDVVTRPFDSVYGGSWTPEFGFFYEFQPFHSEWFGNIGVFISGDFAYSHGFGVFGKTLHNELANVDFPSQSRTQFQFFTVPITAGLNYRFNLFRVVRPFIAAGPSFIGYAESRNDSGKGYRGYSKGLKITGGASFLLDWVSKNSSWDFYTEYGIKHYYLTVEYTKLATFASAVDFSVSGLSAGLTFEY